MGTWNGILIAESLRDPTLINGMAVSRAHITQPVQDSYHSDSPIRWHLYWVSLTEGEIGQLQSQLEHGWYAHFWNQDQILVLYKDKLFKMNKRSKSTWKPAIEHGLGMGIPKEQLDFPTDDSAGNLS